MKRTMFLVLALVVLGTLVLACAPAATPAPTAAPPTAAPKPTQAPAAQATTAPAAQPTAAAAGGVPAGVASTNFKPEYKLSVRTAENTAWGAGAKKFADLMNQKTGGKMNVKVYYSGQLFADKQTNEFPLLGEGVADFAVGSTINWSPQIKEYNVFLLPFMFKSYKEIDAVTHGATATELAKITEAKNVISLAYGENGFRELTNSKKDIAKPEDLQGMKIRIATGKLFIDTFTALGANPTAMNWGEAVTAMQQGVVDGQENPLVGIIIPYKVYDFHKHITMWHYINDPLVFGINKDIYNAFNADMKKIVKDAATEAAAYEVALARAGLDADANKYLQANNIKIDIADPIGYMKQQGVTVTELTDAQLQAFKDKTKPVFDQWAKDTGQALVDMANKDKATAK